MRRIQIALVVWLTFFLSLSLAGQQTGSSSPQALAILQKSLAALTGSQTITDITLTGTARRIAGSDDESGTAVLKALTTGPARVHLSLPSGPRSDVVTIANKCLVGSWSGPDGVFHSVAHHNLTSDSSWFFPAFTVARLGSPGKYIVSSVGQESWNGRTVEHLTAYQPFSFQAPPGVPTFSHLTQMDLFIDSNTLLPVRLSFNVHPDNDMGLDIPVDIAFSDYRVVSGAQVPFHIQRSLNNSLTLDFQAQTVNLNSNLTAVTFSVQ
jgi:hypothetical protein